MLVKRRLETLWELVDEYRLEMDATLVKSNLNQADRLTRVPQRWFKQHREETEPVQSVCATMHLGSQDNSFRLSLHISISTGYLMPNLVYLYTSEIYDL